MKNFLSSITNPLQRRQLMVLISGGLILLALAFQHIFGWKSSAYMLYFLAALFAGWDIALRAWNSLRIRNVSIELLVTVAVTGALVIGEYWEAAAVTFLFIFGAYLEARTLNRTRRVIQSLLDIAPTVALVERFGQQIELPPNRVEPQDTVLLKPGTKIPVDGEVISGRSAVDESAITGEPMPAEKAEGSLVFAGTINQNGLLRVRATGIGADTTLARIIRRVEEAQEEKAPTQRFIERFARWYTPLIIISSIVFFALTRNLELALTLLVIACPGALVISTPVSVVSGIGRAAKHGILIKGGEYLENSGKISALAFDKTGTLTLGKPRVTDVIPLLPAPIAVEAALALEYAVSSGSSSAFNSNSPSVQNFNMRTSGKWDEDQQNVLYWTLGAESGSEHPLAKAIMAEAENLTLYPALPAPESFEAISGRGVKAMFFSREVLVGTPELMREFEVETSTEANELMRQLKTHGKTAILVAVDGQVLGILGISDPVRASAPTVIKQLKASGVKQIVMLTGDDALTAHSIAEQVGIEDVRARLLPEDKLNVIRQLQQEGYVVAMTGDGINDAPALAAADIGIAMGVGGTGVAIETADIALMSDDLTKIPEAIRLSKSTLRNIRQNVVIALVTVSVLVLGVLLGKVHMAGGMLIHEASVLIVILNGMRLLRA